MTTRKIAVIVGSNRKDSINRQLAAALARLSNRLEFAFVAIDDLPIYNQDVERPLPAPVARFKGELSRADGFLFVTPEHNRSIPAVLKNAIDWGARPYGQNSWNGKPAAITGTTPGAIGTAVGQAHLRQVLGVLGALVMGGEAYITFKPGLIGADGAIADEATRKFLQTSSTSSPRWRRGSTTRSRRWRERHHSARTSGSLSELDVRVLHDAAPALHLGGHERAEFVRRVLPVLMLSLSSRSVTVGSFISAFMPALSFWMISAGVPVGTNTPFHS